MKGDKKRGPREEIGDRSGSLSNLFSSLKCSFVPGYQERRRSQTTASSLPLSPAADRELRLSLRTILPRGRWGLGCTRRWRTVNPQKQDGFSLRLSGTCPFKGYKPSQSLDSLPRPLSPINYTMWKEKKKKETSGQLKITQGSGVWHASLSSRVEPFLPEECSGNSDIHTSLPRRLRVSGVPPACTLLPR